MELLLINSKYEKTSVHVESLEDASKAVQNHIRFWKLKTKIWMAYDKAGYVLDNGEEIAFVSYNGRVWNLKDSWQKNGSLIMNAVKIE